MRSNDPLSSNFHAAPGSFGNEFRQENFEFVKQKTYLEWNPPKSSHVINYSMYDRVNPYDITKEN